MALARQRMTCPQASELDPEEARRRLERSRHDWEASQKADRIAEARQRARDAANVPSRYVGCSFSNFTPETAAQARVLKICKRYVETFAEQMRIGRCMAMIGKMGTGKTHLACATVNALCDSGISAQYSTVDAMTTRWRGTYRNESAEQPSDVLAAFMRPRLLVLDEVGIQHASEHELLVINRICSQRHDAGNRPTFFIGNITEPQLADFLGDRIADRLSENQGVILTFDWSSYRTRKTA